MENQQLRPCDHVRRRAGLANILPPQFARLHDPENVIRVPLQIARIFFAPIKCRKRQTGDNEKQDDINHALYQQDPGL